jgi:hypothetical protein
LKAGQYGAAIWTRNLPVVLFVAKLNVCLGAHVVITNGCSNLAKLQILWLFQNFVKGCLREFARMYFNIVFEIIFELKYLKPEILKGSQCGTSRK